MSPDTGCPCGSGKHYNSCCQPYHTGSALPETALTLMRSRYTAYAYNLPDYLMATTHPGSPYYRDNRHLWRRALSKFSQSHNFRQLEIVEAKERDPFASVIFIAHLLFQQEDTSFCEKSFFEKWKGRWWYQRGDVREGALSPFDPIGSLNLLALAYYGTAVLRQKAAPVAQITEEIHALAAAMVETMDACEGVGLAAPQVHRSLRLFVMRIPIEKEGKIGDLGEARVVINPEIVEHSHETWIAPEGCLSIPTFYADVERPVHITLRFLNLQGERVTLHASRWEARIILHEYDHLEGVLFLDHLAPKDKKASESVTRALVKRLGS